MTGRTVDQDVVRAKLDGIERSCATLRSIGAVDAGTLEQDSVVAAAVERLLCRLVDLAVDINSHLAAAVLWRSPGDYRDRRNGTRRSPHAKDARACISFVQAGRVEVEVSADITAYACGQRPADDSRAHEEHGWLSAEYEQLTAPVPDTESGQRPFRHSGDQRRVAVAPREYGSETAERYHRDEDHEIDHGGVLQFPQQ